MKGKHHTKESKKLMSQAKNNIYNGENNPNYKDGNKCRLNKWIELVKERDQYTCRHCLIDLNYITIDHIVAHHIFPKKEYPELIYNIDNGITLCASCHMKLHMKTRIRKKESSLKQAKSLRRTNQRKKEELENILNTEEK